MMPGGSHHKSSSHRPPPSTSTSAVKDPPSDRKSDPKQPNPNPNPNPTPNPSQRQPAASANSIPPPPFFFPDLGPPPPPTYGFHMLDRRTIVLADGTVRSYFALPPDYHDFPPLPPRFHPPSDFPGGGGGLRFPPMSPQGPAPRDKSQNQNSSLKRKFAGGGSEEKFKNWNNNPNGFSLAGPGAGTSSPFRRDMGNELRVGGKHMRVSGGDYYAAADRFNNKHLDVDRNAVKKAFLHFSKTINENEVDRKRYLGGGKQGRLKCVACDRSSKDYSDMHALILHTYNSDNAGLRVDHLGLHKALCVLMGWNYSKSPDNSKAYQFLPADEAAANRDDLIMWPPMVIIHNTITGKGNDGRMEGLGNKAMDNKMRDLGFTGGKSKSLYGREGHLGITLVKFNGDQLGLKEALQLGDHFEKENHGRKAWERLQPLIFGKDDDKNPNLVKIDRSGEKKRIFYGYLGTGADLCKVDYETRKKVKIESLGEQKASK